MTRPSDTRAYRWRLAGMLACGLMLVALAGCGAREGIPRDEAKDIEAALNEVDEQFRNGECTTLPGAVTDLQASVDGLSRKVDEEIQKVLDNSVEELAGLASSECVEAPEPEPDPITTSTTTTTPVETEEETTTTDPVTTETEDEPPVEPEIPEEKPGKEPKIKPPKGEFPDAPVDVKEDDG